MPGVNSIKLLTGNSHPELAQMVADRLGIQQTICVCKKFADQSIDVRIGSSVRDEDVFVLQTSNSPYVDPNDSLMELCIIISACRTASARRITAVIPCFPYSRHDKKDKSRAPITAKLVANMITVAGADHVITMDLHASQIQGFFDIPVDNLTSEPSVARWIRQCVPNYRDAIIVSPDAGGAKRATSLADLLGVDFALINRNRKREANKRLRAAAAQAQGISRASSFSDLRSGLSTPMTGSFMVEPSASSSSLASGAGGAHAGDTVGTLRAEALAAGRSASPGASATLGAVNAQLATLHGDSSDAATTPRPPHLEAAFAPSPPRGGPIRGATPVTAQAPPAQAQAQAQASNVVNGVKMNGAGDWIATDEDGRKVASGGSRAQSQNRAAAAGEEENKEEDEAETKMEILVGDVDGKVAILVDDMVDTGRTLALAAKTLKEAGAKAVYAHISHGILSGASIDLLRRLDMERLVVTNTIPNLEKARRSEGKLEIMDVSAVIAESIRRTHNGESISLLFQEDSVLL